MLEVLCRFSKLAELHKQGVLHVPEAPDGFDALLQSLLMMVDVFDITQCIVGLAQAHAHPIQLDRGLQSGLFSVLLLHFVPLLQALKHPTKPSDHCSRSLLVCFLHG